MVQLNKGGNQEPKTLNVNAQVFKTLNNKALCKIVKTENPNLYRRGLSGFLFLLMVFGHSGLFRILCLLFRIYTIRKFLSPFDAEPYGIPAVVKLSFIPLQST